MKVRWLLALGVVLAVVGLGTAQAQPPGPGGPGFRPGFGPGMGGGPVMLLMNPQVQKELGLTEEQIGKLREVGRSLMEQSRERFQGLRDLSPEERRQRMAALMEEARAQAEEALKPVLTAEQLKRLRQIELQVALQGPGGVRTLLRKDVAEALGLTEEQRQKLEALADKIAEQMREAFRPGAGPEAREQMQKRMEELRGEARAEVEKILNQEQLGKLKELLGAPFKLEMPAGFGPGRGAGPGPGAGPGGERPRRGGDSGGRRGAGRPAGQT